MFRREGENGVQLLKNMDDTAALQLLRQEQEGFSLFYQQVFPILYYISSAILPAGSPVKASVLESILEAMSEAREISSDTPLRGWLCAITAQKALKRAPLSQMGADMFSDPKEPLTNPDNLQALSGLINQLSRSAQVLLMLYIYGECTVPQLSELTGWPEPLVTSILERSLRHLRRCITVTDGSNPISRQILFMVFLYRENQSAPGENIAAQELTRTLRALERRNSGSRGGSSSRGINSGGFFHTFLFSGLSLPEELFSPLTPSWRKSCPWM